MTSTLEEKKKIVDFMSNFPQKSKDEGWISHYDTDSDSFIFRIPKLSVDVHKRYFDDEFAFYWNNKNNIEGLFIEYFTSNFISHDKDLKSLVSKEIKNKKDESVIQFNKRDIQKIVSKLENAMLNSAVPNSIVYNSATTRTRRGK